jgi:two-component system, NarL family, response regulator DegU
MGTRVLVVDDHRLVREGLRRTLVDAGMDVVGEAEDGERALAKAIELQPDVALMDITMPSMDGLTVTRRLRSRAPSTRVVVLTMHDDEGLLEQAFAAGAVGYLLKDAGGAEVVEAVRRAHEEGAATWSELGQGAPALHAPPAPDGPALSDREREVLQLFADGCRPGEVAARLFISPKTVRNHLSHIYAKLEVGDRSQAIVVALRHGLIDLPDR